MNTSKHILSRKVAKPKAFTLIELLVVVSIISLLLAVIMPSLSAAKLQVQKMICGNNLRQLGYAQRLYANDYRDYFSAYGYWTWWMNNRGLIWEDIISGKYNQPPTYDELLPYLIGTKASSRETNTSGIVENFIKITTCPTYMRGRYYGAPGSPIDNVLAGGGTSTAAQGTTYILTEGPGYSRYLKKPAAKFMGVPIPHRAPLYTDFNGGNYIGYKMFSHGLKGVEKNTDRRWVNALMVDGHVELKGFSNAQEYGDEFIVNNYGGKASRAWGSDKWW